jgi:class 3 adenylate cyclase
MQELPGGTVTFVFTDIEGSTELLKQLGERYGQVLTQHRRIVREHFSAGIEIDTQGDAFFFAFPRAREAVAAAVDVQRAHAAAEWPDGSVVRVRIGLHTGEPSVGEEGYLGLDVVRAARICSAGRGGSVLLSESTRALVGSALPEDVSVFPLGEHHLKDIDEPERVYELEIAGVESGVPAEPRPAPAHGSLEDVGAGLSERIQQQVWRSIEGALGKHGPVETGPTPDESDVDVLAARAASLEQRITARVEEALRARGITKKGKS